MEEVLKAIKEALKKAGVDEKHAERVQKLFGIEKEDVVDNFVALFKDNVLPSISEAEKAAEKAAKAKAVADYEKKHGLKDGKTIETPQPPAPADFSGLSPEMKAVFEAQQKSIKDLTDLVGGVVKSQTNAQKLETAREKMKGKVDENFLDRYVNRVNLDAENLDAEIEERIKEFTEDKQAFLNEAVSGGAYVPASGVGAVNSDKDIDAFIESKSKSAESSDFTGIKI